MKKKIAILGAGNMGGVIAESLRGSNYDVAVTAHSQATLDRVKEACPEFTTTISNVAAVAGADIVILAIKPYILPGVAQEIKTHLKPDAIVISLVAAVSIADVDKMLSRAGTYLREGPPEKLKIFRVIPNTAIRLGKSATFIATAPDTPKKYIEEVEAIFKRSGKVFPVAENDMAAVTALSSCGIAYFLRFIRAATEGSVELGLRPRFATEVAAATVEGAAALIADGSHPEVEIDKVTTPGGLTIRGLNVLEANGFTHAIIEALKASFKN